MKKKRTGMRHNKEKTSSIPVQAGTKLQCPSEKNPDRLFPCSLEYVQSLLGGSHHLLTLGEVSASLHLLLREGSRRGHTVTPHASVADSHLSVSLWAILVYTEHESVSEHSSMPPSHLCLP